MKREDHLRLIAEQTLSNLFVWHIRHRLEYDPDHSAPEDGADEFAAQVVPIVVSWLDCVDYQKPVLTPIQVLRCEQAPMRKSDRGR